jgi:hypothetical protein
LALREEGAVVSSQMVVVSEDTVRELNRTRSLVIVPSVLVRLVCVFVIVAVRMFVRMVVIVRVLVRMVVPRFVGHC